MFVGFVDLDATLNGLVVTVLGGPPVAPVAPPTFTVYGTDALTPILAGTATKFLADVGLYSYSIPALGSSGFDLAGTYRIVFRYTANATACVLTHTFQVT